MHLRAAAATFLVGGTILLVGCSLGHGGNGGHSAPPKAAPTTVPAAALAPKSSLSVNPTTAACWWAIRDQYVPGTAQLTGEPSLPPQCAGLNPDDISDVVRDVLAHQSDK